MLTKGIRVRITKRSILEGSHPPDPHHIAGQDCALGASLPIDYTVEGELKADVKVGDSIVLYRTHRNGVRQDGMFVTSTVRSIVKEVDSSEVNCSTINSVYSILPI